MLVPSSTAESMSKSSGSSQQTFLSPKGPEPSQLWPDFLQRNRCVSCTAELRKLTLTLALVYREMALELMWSREHALGEEWWGRVGCLLAQKVFPWVRRCRYRQLGAQRRPEGYGLDSDTAWSSLWGVVNPLAWWGRSLWRDQRTPKTKTHQSLENL